MNHRWMFISYKILPYILEESWWQRWKANQSHDLFGGFNGEKQRHRRDVWKGKRSKGGYCNQSSPPACTHDPQKYVVTIVLLHMEVIVHASLCLFTGIKRVRVTIFFLTQLHVWPAEGDLCWEVPVLALRSYQTRRTDFNDFVSRRFHRRSQETGAFPGAVIHTHSLVHAIIRLFMFTNTHSNLHWLYRWIKFFYRSWHNKIQERQPRTQIGCKLPHWWSLTEVSPVCVSCLSSTRQCALLYHSVKC